jgi:large subunit ribosomal protein L32
MVIRMRHTKAHRNNRRSHHALAGTKTGVCEKCGKDTLPHRACPHCGAYRGRIVGAVTKKLDKRIARMEAKQKAQQGAAAPKEEKKPKKEKAEKKTTTKKKSTTKKKEE